ncbi:AMP-binding enzyme [Hirsutella rhossiliensis]|uniref:AMP-binding enzyme domain-containing protein n=1 Tax=Hirsutella rhossiliensis TaxID=111463 RepID=A0A9P8SHG8_9HYPO|nr:AMP-binding enzyme domain-containing protein [Hirsutella rhossiliensis]KAH0963078.1 AMP-binding enzyme domain-containing protein [Hirsutella rhossiliensis]
MLLHSRRANLGQLVAAQAARRPRKTAAEHGPVQLSYAELHAQATMLAQKLCALPFHAEEPVVILAPPGLEHIISQMGVVYAGGTCLPLDPSMSDADIEARANLAGACILITSPHVKGREISVRHKITMRPAKICPAELAQDSFSFPVPVAPDYRSHILFTSGTTGKPKGVEILGRSIIRLHKGVFDPEDRVAHCNSVSFDASLLDIWTTLMIGATVVVVERDTLLNQQLFTQLLDQEIITAMFLTSVVFNAIALSYPSAFSKCNSVLTGGEAPNHAAIRKVLERGPPKSFLHVYGLTECGVLSTSYQVSLYDVCQGYIPLGEPLKSTELFLVNNSHRLVRGQGTGELFIGGQGLARGYLGNAAKTSSAFLHIPGVGGDGEVKLLYRTGDIVQRDGQGRLFWRGRRNNEVKHRGHRVSLDAIESALH